jgi:hypothetical protein
VACALLASALGMPASVSAQASPLVLEVGGGAAIPVGALRSGHGPGQGTSAGASFDLDFAVSGAGRRTVFVGFSQHRFGCSAAGCAAGAEYVATGVDLGVRWSLLTSGPVLPWLGVGALTTRVELPPMQQFPAGVSALGLGGDVGLGVYIGASRAVALNPSVWLRAVNTGLGDGRGALRMRYLVANLAVALAF